VTELLAYEDCAGCHADLAPPRLLVRCGGMPLCWACWKAAGKPSADAVMAAHEMETLTRKRMQERGGTDRHLVRNGRT
jgi:hypothetical protein